MKTNMIYVAVVAFMAMACVEENFKQPNPFEGDEVLFSATLTKEPVTRTIYGEEVKYQLDEDGNFVLDENGNKIELTSPEMVVNWVHGDKIKVWASEIASRNEAEYSVNTNNQVQNYAVSLDKTGDYGIQWGTETSSDFCAIYPSDNVSKFEKNGDAIIASTSINAAQNNVFAAVKDDATGKVIGWDGTHFGNDAANPSMQNAIMFARTADATPVDDNGNPKQVNLHFKPYTTVLKFRFLGYTSNLTDPTVYIQNITVKAPEGVAIAGDFNLGISGTGADAAATATLPTEEGKSASDSIRVTTILPGGTYIPLKAGQYVDFNVYTIPQSYQMNATDKLWTVTIYTQGHGKFTYKMKPIPVNNGDGTTSPVTYNLTAGEIHKVKIPTLPINSQIEWNPENWITQIPKPVYISELSVPGAWYCTNSAYQNHTTLSDLYNAGIRAFHIDCRVTKVAGSYTWFSKFNASDEAYLAVAGTESTSTSFLNINLKQGTEVLDVVKQIVALAKQHPDEYVVIVLTIAEQPKNDSDQTIMGSVAPSVVLPYIGNIITNTDPISYTVDGVTKTTSIQASLYTDITADTTVDDLIGEKNVMIKINANTNKLYQMASVPNTLISFASMASDTNHNTQDDEITDLSQDYFAKMNDDSLFVGKNYNGLTYYYHQCQRTTSGIGSDYSNTYQIDGIPTLQMRMDAVDDIIDKSKEIYDNAQHNAWFQMGIGGVVKDRDGLGASEDHKMISTKLNEHVYNRIIEKMDTDPSPVGLVLMNHCTTVVTENNQQKIVGDKLVKAIIEMNGKFYLNRKGGSITTGDGTGSGSGSGSGSTTSTKNAAYAVVGDNAF